MFEKHYAEAPLKAESVRAEKRYAQKRIPPFLQGKTACNFVLRFSSNLSVFYSPQWLNLGKRIPTSIVACVQSFIEGNIKVNWSCKCRKHKSFIIAWCARKNESLRCDCHTHLTTIFFQTCMNWHKIQQIEHNPDVFQTVSQIERSMPHRRGLLRCWKLSQPSLQFHSLILPVPKGQRKVRLCL